ncbi:uncharacterized protein At4g26450 isoform X2 [Abrus precatorius]|uniref:Uncharacterized protein At4g26450 isoform X2 n=1 Tax=Abrus precatorius TaxID=3816 RepID=A0A8B8JIB4_ABRPR|nr:uncharacterized protein At4g26450 isoform X2 [Abrus precatorius]
MHPRQRSPRGFYPSEYRHRDVGFGRGHLGRRGGGGGGVGGGDIFIEAGRLAAEYLVSQGLLPPNVLSLKWNNHNGGFKKHVGAGEIPAEGGRTSALARLGNAVEGGPSGRRKLGFDEFGQKGRRRGSFSRNNGLDWGRDYRRNGSWSDRDRFRGTPEMKDDDDGGGGGVSVRQQDEDLQHQQVGGSGDVVDDVSQKLNSNEFVPRSEDGDGLNATEMDTDRVSGELVDLKQSAFGAAGKDVCDMDMEFAKSSNDLDNASAGVKEVKDGDGNDDNDEKLSVSKNLSAQSSDQDNSSSGGAVIDLLSSCKFVKLPTRMRSSLVRKNLKARVLGSNGDASTRDIGDLPEPEVLAENESVKESSSGDLLVDKTYDIVHLDPDIAEVEPIHAAENVKELDTACKAEEVQSIGSQSSQDGGYMHDNKHQEASAALSEYGSCSSLAEERGEKRVAEDDDVREDNKRLREWLPSLVPKTGDYFLHSEPIEVKESPGEDEISHIDKVTLTSDQGSLMSSSQFTEGGDRPFLQCSEEKPSLPSSFRTCDLNLIEASEVHENHVDHPVLIFPPAVSETKKAVPIDIDLTMSHASVSGKFSTHTAGGKEIEVIDLENDSIQEEKPMDNIDRKTETMFPGLEGFSNHAQNAADMHDVQDGYGLMISELLGPDFPNCSSVPGNINSVHNEMNLHNGTGTLAEDDSIYMSLEELSFLRPWEQPPSQDYQKHF